MRTWETISEASLSAIVTVKSNKTSVSSSNVAEAAVAPVTVGVSATALTTTAKLSVVAALSSAPTSLDVTLVVTVAVPE